MEIRDHANVPFIGWQICLDPQADLVFDLSPMPLDLVPAACGSVVFILWGYSKCCWRAYRPPPFVPGSRSRLTRLKLHQTRTGLSNSDIHRADLLRRHISFGEVKQQYRNAQFHIGEGHLDARRVAFREIRKLAFTRLDRNEREVKGESAHDLIDQRAVRVVESYLPDELVGSTMIKLLPLGSRSMSKS